MAPSGHLGCSHLFGPCSLLLSVQSCKRPVTTFSSQPHFSISLLFEGLNAEGATLPSTPSTSVSITCGPSHCHNTTFVLTTGCYRASQSVLSFAKTLTCTGLAQPPASTCRCCETFTISRTSAFAFARSRRFVTLRTSTLLYHLTFANFLK